jgi:hypothetical protein
MEPQTFTEVTSEQHCTPTRREWFFDKMNYFVP